MNDVVRALSALNSLDPSCSREEWIRIGMAAKSAGLPFDAFHNWSKNAGNYKGGNDCASVWRSFSESGAITTATLFGMAHAQGWQVTNKTYPNLVNDHNNYQNRKILVNDKVVTLQALDIWERCLPVSSTHEYILRKQGSPDGLRYYPSSEPPLIIKGKNVADYLVVPCWVDDELQTLQFISPNKSDKKLNLKGGFFNQGFFVVGNITDLIYICEGIGQAWSVNAATGFASVVCFGFSRIKTVAKALREKYPNMRLVIVPDCGKEKQASEIATTIAAQWIELPQERPTNYDVNDYAQEFGYDKLARLLTTPRTPNLRYKLLAGSDLVNSPPMRWLVQGVIPTEGLAALYGESGSGKSFLILDMAFAIADGEAYWFGRRVAKAAVTYICLEGESGLGKRIKAWSHYFNKPVPAGVRFVTQPFNLLSDDVTELANAIIASEGAGGLVIIDTLNRAAPGADENSSVDMGKIIASAKKLQNLLGGLILLVHHCGKDKSKGLRGHSSLYAALDGSIEVIKTDSRREWSVAKSKDDVTGDSYQFKLDIVKVGFDDYDQEITSCVALFDGANEIIPKQASLGRNQKLALEEIDKQLNATSHVGEGGASATTRCVNYDGALKNVAERIPTDAKHRMTRAKEAVAGLVERKYLGFNGGWLWRI